MSLELRAWKGRSVAVVVLKVTSDAGLLHVYLPPPRR